MQGFAICSTLPARSEVFACKGVCWYCLRDDPRWKMTYHHYCYYYHLAPHEKPWSFCVLNAGPGPVSLVCTTRVGGCLEKGCATCSGLGGRRGRGGGRWWWGGHWPARVSRREGGPSLARLGWCVEGPGTTCKGDGQTRQGQLVHTHRHPVLTTTHSSNLPHIPRPVQFINLLNPQIKAILLNGYYHMGLIHIHKPRKWNSIVRLGRITDIVKHKFTSMV